MSFVSLYLYVPDEGSLLPKYRDCTTSNDFESYIYIYIFIYIYIYIYIYKYIQIVKKYVRDTLIPTILLKHATFRSS